MSDLEITNNDYRKSTMGQFKNFFDSAMRELKEEAEFQHPSDKWVELSTLKEGECFVQVKRPKYVIEDSIFVLTMPAYVVVEQGKDIIVQSSLSNKFAYSKPHFVCRVKQIHFLEQEDYWSRFESKVGEKIPEYNIQTIQELVHLLAEVMAVSEERIEELAKENSLVYVVKHFLVPYVRKLPEHIDMIVEAAYDLEATRGTWVVHGRSKLI